MSYNFALRIWTIVVAVFTALAVVVFILKPLVLEKWNLLNTNGCIEIQYWQIDNSVIAHAIPSGYWIWYNGTDVYVFGEPAGRVCSNPNYEPAYVVDLGKNEILGYECVMHLVDIIDYYQQNGTKEKYIYERIPPYKWKTFNVYDMINMLVDKKVIFIRKTDI